MIAGYLGKSEAADDAIASFAAGYADQTEKDYEALKAAVQSGRIVADTSDWRSPANPTHSALRSIALGNTKTLFNRDNAAGPADNLATSMRSVVIDVHDYDWEGDQPLCGPMQDMIIYEMHVGGFTRHPSSGVNRTAPGA
jgi:pullulanase/glycogen debranching enzyme